MGLFEAASLFMTAGADLDGNYRYSLYREWEPKSPSVTWLMLNPSTATDEELDPTLRRCAEFTAGWGYGRFDVVNLFAYRSTDPDGLLNADVGDPVGPRNDAAIVEACKRATLVICGGGRNIERTGLSGRDTHVLRLLRSIPLSVLRLTEGGHPHHPLYLPADLRPYGWRIPRS